MTRLALCILFLGLAIANVPEEDFIEVNSALPGTLNVIKLSLIHI